MRSKKGVSILLEFSDQILIQSIKFLVCQTRNKDTRLLMNVKLVLPKS